MAAACKAPVTVMKTSGEGGAYGIALLAAFVAERTENITLEEYLDERVFKDVYSVTVQPDMDDMNGFDKYTENYMKLLAVEKAAIENI
jgi:sugar (pentulose or hexulose) kinase